MIRQHISTCIIFELNLFLLYIIITKDHLIFRLKTDSIQIKNYILFIYESEVLYSMNSNKLTKPLTICLIAIFCCLLWGSAFPVIKLGYAAFQIPSTSTGSQLLFAGIRFTLAGILTILFGSIINKKILLPRKENWYITFKLSLVQTVAQYLFFYIGLSNTTGVKSSIINASSTFMAILIPTLIFHQEKLSKQKVLGCLIGFAGVILINISGSSIDFSMKMTGEGFIFLSALSYAFSSVLMKGYSKKEEPVVLSGYQFAMGGSIMIVAGLLMGGIITTYTIEGICILLYLSFVSAVAYTLWAILLKHNPVSKVAVYGFMTPVCGVTLSALLLHETSQAFGMAGFISLLLVCNGIYIVNKA